MENVKSLYIMRHAEAESPLFNQKDFFRKLNLNGIKQLHLLNDSLKNNCLELDFVFVSNAIRTKETFQIIQHSIRYKEVIFKDDLYIASQDNLMQLLTHLNDEIGNVLIIGHNPSVSHLVTFLAGLTHYDMPTGLIAELQFESDNWRMASQNSFSLKNQWR
jgi:phosphohistidine phosphatase